MFAVVVDNMAYYEEVYFGEPLTQNQTDAFTRADGTVELSMPVQMKDLLLGKNHVARVIAEKVFDGRVTVLSKYEFDQKPNPDDPQSAWVRFVVLVRI